MELGGSLPCSQEPVTAHSICCICIYPPYLEVISFIHNLGMCNAVAARDTLNMAFIMARNI
jgi:hypothetical protein